MAANQNSEAAKQRKSRKANFSASELVVLTEEVEANIIVLKVSDIVIDAISALRTQKKRPDSIGKLAASKHGLDEKVIVETVEALLANAIICNRPNKLGQESLYVSKTNVSFITK